MVFQSDLFPVSADNSYDLSGSFKADGGSFRLLFGLLPYDQEKRPIKAINLRTVKGTETVLTSPCSKKDKILKVKDASKWKPLYYVAFEPEKGIPNFKVTKPVDNVYKSGEVWFIKLRHPCGFNYPAGTQIAAHQAGNNGIFLFNGNIPEKWLEVKEKVIPPMIKQWPGIKFASLYIKPMIPKNSNIKFYIDDISIKKIITETEK